MITFIKGRSVTFTLVFNDEYDSDNIEDIVVKIGKDTVGMLSLNTVLTTANPRVFRLQLTSEYTASLREMSNIQVFLDDAVMGVRPFEQQLMRAYKQLDFSNPSVNLGSDFTLNLTIEEGSEAIAVDTVTIYNALGGGANAALKANNLSDLASASTARTNLGLGNVNNTSDANKPISSLAQTALNAKLNTPSGLTTNHLQKWNGSSFSNAGIVQVGGNIGMGSATNPGELFHIGDGNILLEGGGEVAQKFKRDFNTTGENLGVPTGSGVSVNPIFQIGRIIQAGDGDPEIRIMYSDDNTTERTVFEVDRKGIAASVKTAVGSHFEGFASLTDVNPMFRLNSYPRMRLEMGAGGNNVTDVAVERDANGGLAFFTNSTNQSSISANGFLPPRLTTTQRTAISSPSQGLVIFNTTTTKLECYDGTVWQSAW